MSHTCQSGGAYVTLCWLYSHLTECAEAYQSFAFHIYVDIVVPILCGFQMILSVRPLYLELSKEAWT